jgi:hypothetical protein
MKLRQVVAGLKIDPDLVIVSGLVIVLRDSFPDVSRSSADYSVFLRVILSRSPKDLDPQRPLFRRLTVALQAVFDDIAQKLVTSFAVLERRMG